MASLFTFGVDELEVQHRGVVDNNSLEAIVVQSVDAGTRHNGGIVGTREAEPPVVCHALVFLEAFWSSKV